MSIHEEKNYFLIRPNKKKAKVHIFDSECGVILCNPSIKTDAWIKECDGHQDLYFMDNISSSKRVCKRCLLIAGDIMFHDEDYHIGCPNWPNCADYGCGEE